MDTPQDRSAAGNDSPASGLRDCETWVFDLDNTLYPASCRLFVEVSDRIHRYVTDALGLPSDEAFALQKQYLRDYGTTLRGMMSCHGTDPGDYLTYVHDIDLSPLEPAPDLDSALDGLPGRKVVFTNASVAHAERVMDRLGIARHFADIFDVAAAGYVPKPVPEVYAALVERYGFDPTRAVMVEDMARNLRPAADLGMTTVLIRSDLNWHGNESIGEHIHHVVDDLAYWLHGVAGTDRDRVRSSSPS